MSAQNSLEIHNKQRQIVMFWVKELFSHLLSVSKAFSAAGITHTPKASEFPFFTLNLLGL